MMLKKLSQYYFNAGLKNAKEGMIQTAVENLMKSLRYDNSNAGAWKLIGLCHYRIGRLAAAEYCWSKCVDLDKTDSGTSGYLEEVRNTIGAVTPHFKELFQLFAQKKYKKASMTLQKKIMPILDDQADIYKVQGILLMLRKRKRKALHQWKKVFEIDCIGVPGGWYL